MNGKDVNTIKLNVIFNWISKKLPHMTNAKIDKTSMYKKALYMQIPPIPIVTDIGSGK